MCETNLEFETQMHLTHTDWRVWLTGIYWFQLYIGWKCYLSNFHHSSVFVENLQALPNDKCVFQIFVPRINFDENIVWRKKQKIVTETDF